MFRRRPKDPGPNHDVSETLDHTADAPLQRQLKRRQDDSSDDDSDSDEVMEDQGEKQLELLNLPQDAGKYPFDSAVEKTMLRLLNCLKQFRLHTLYEFISHVESHYFSK